MHRRWANHRIRPEWAPTLFLLKFLHRVKKKCSSIVVWLLIQQCIARWKWLKFSIWKNLWAWNEGKLRTLSIIHTYKSAKYFQRYINSKCYTLVGWVMATIDQLLAIFAGFFFNSYRHRMWDKDWQGEILGLRFVQYAHHKWLDTMYLFIRFTYLVPTPLFC